MLKQFRLTFMLLICVVYFSACTQHTKLSSQETVAPSVDSNTPSPDVGMPSHTTKLKLPKAIDQRDQDAILELGERYVRLEVTIDHMVTAGRRPDDDLTVQQIRDELVDIQREIENAGCRAGDGRRGCFRQTRFPGGRPGTRTTGRRVVRRR